MRRAIIALAVLGTLGALGAPVHAEGPPLAPADCDARLGMFTTLATWCEACRKEMPRLRQIRERFSAGELTMFGVPVDETDDEGRLRAWSEKLDPPYEVLVNLSRAQVEAVQRRVVDDLGQELLPATIVTDCGGRVLATEVGVPSVSRLREILFEMR